MEPKELKAEIGATSYPGRGIVVGRTPDGSHAVIAYFIMGRSVNSRNRVFTEDGAGIRTEAADPSKMEDPSLIIYAPVRVLGNDTIVTNGDQTDTVYEGLKAGKSFSEALMTREFEPDAPNYTPRISAVLHTDGDLRYEISILKSNYGDPSQCCRFFYNYDHPAAGEGHFIHTYLGDGSPLPSFEGEPTRVVIPGNDLDAFTETVWNSLNPDNKVSLFTRMIRIADGAAESRIVNKYNKA